MSRIRISAKRASRAEYTSMLQVGSHLSDLPTTIVLVSSFWWLVFGIWCVASGVWCLTHYDSRKCSIIDYLFGATINPATRRDKLTLYRLLPFDAKLTIARRPHVWMILSLGGFRVVVRSFPSPQQQCLSPEEDL